MEALQAIWKTVSETAWIAILLQAALTFLITWGVVKLINRAFEKLKNKKNLNIQFLRRILTGIVWIIGVLQILSLIPGMSSLARTVLAGSGIAAVVIGLAAQESCGNLVSGFLIAMFHPFNVGDRVHLIGSNLTGWVEDITLRHTVIRTSTNSRIIIPNSEMSTEKIENSDYADSAVSDAIEVSVSYESDLERAMEIMGQVIGDHPLYYDTRSREEKLKDAPKVRVFVKEFADSGIVLRASMWTRTINENYGACSDARFAIKKAFDQEGIEIPYQKLVILPENKES